MKRLAFVSMLSGCSLIGVNGPSSRPSPSAEPCTSDYSAPVVDSLITIGGAVGTYEVKTHDANTSIGKTFRDSVAFPSVLLTTLVFAVSAIHGFSEVHECRRSLRVRKA